MSRDLRVLFDPRSVAIVGASNDPLKWGYGLSRGALRGASRRAVYLVNRGGGEILGQETYRSLADLPATPELAVIAVPEQGFEEAVEAALSVGARAIVGITAGLGERGERGRDRELAIAERVRAAGAVLLGPNCLGVFDADTELDIGWSELPAGAIGLVSQSGNLALELALLAADYGLGFSRFASLGNQADLDATDLVLSLAEHESTRVIALYLEDFRDGRAFARACHAAVRAGKPVVLLAAGRSRAGVEAARSHTGALVGDLAAVDAACRAAGIDQVATPRELVDLVQALLVSHPPAGRRLAVFGDGGGHAVVAADLADADGLELPRLSDATAQRLADALGPTAETRNPVDFAGGGEQDLRRFEEVTRILLHSGEVDSALLTGYFGGYAEYGAEYAAVEAEVAEGMAAAAAGCKRPLVVQTMYPTNPAAVAFRRTGVPVYREIEAAVGALASLAARSSRNPTGVPDLPEQRSGAPAAAGYFEARKLLQAAGVAFADAYPVTTPGQALEAASELGYPVVLKALGLLHKSDEGGVALGILTPAELEQVFSAMTTRLSARLYSVERMAPVESGVELIAGVRRDIRFGPVALGGIGGLYAEVLRDVAVALAPVSETDAQHMLLALRGAQVFTGARGRRPVDLAAAARVVSLLSRVAAERAEIAEIEVNPLLATPDGAIGLDARIVLVDSVHPTSEGDGDAR